MPSAAHSACHRSNSGRAAAAAALADEFPDAGEQAVASLGVVGGPLPGAERAGIERVAAGHAGGFLLTVGVDRGAGADSLLEHGADLVVDDLAELIPSLPGGAA